MTTANHLIALLGLFAQISGQTVGRELIEFTARKLIPLGVPEVCEALERMLETGRKFPTVAEVKAEMGIAEPTAKDVGLRLADTIFNAIAKYGEIPPGNLKTAAAVENALGPAVWSVVTRQGGWNAVVQRAGENQGVYRAQLRDLGESYARSGIIDPASLPARIPSLGTALLAEPPKALPESPRSMGWLRELEDKFDMGGKT